MEKTYKITQETCSSMIGDRVCPGCGGVLTPHETVDNSGDPTFWAACSVCETFSWGVPSIVHQIAEKLVTEHNHIEYDFITRPDGKNKAYEQYYHSEQVRGTTSIVGNILRIHSQLTPTKR